MRQIKIRLWTEIIALVAAAACVLAALVAAPAIVGGKPAETPQSPPSPTVPTQTYEGMITDTHCNAKHSAAIGMTASDCTRVCVHSGEHFSLLEGDSVYALDGEAALLKKLAGRRVRIVGTLIGNKISVASVSAD